MRNVAQQNLFSFRSFYSLFGITSEGRPCPSLRFMARGIVLLPYYCVRTHEIVILIMMGLIFSGATVVEAEEKNTSTASLTRPRPPTDAAEIACFAY